MLQAIVKVDKLKADDEFFNTYNIEEEDLAPSICRLKLFADPEFLQIIEESQKLTKEFLESKNDEVSKLMLQA